MPKCFFLPTSVNAALLPGWKVIFCISVFQIATLNLLLVSVLYPWIFLAALELFEIFKPLTISHSMIIFASIIYLLIVYTFLFLFPTSFSLTEASIVSQILSLMYSSYFFVLYFIDLKDNFITQDFAFEMSLIGLSCVLISFICSCIFFAFKDEFFHRVAIPPILFALSFVLLNGVDKITNLASEMFKNRFTLLMWMIYSAVFIVLIIKYSKGLSSKNRQKQNAFRKLYHFLLAIILTPIYYSNLGFLKLVLGLLLAPVLLLEFSRVISKFQALNDFFQRFSNSFDAGNLIVSHIFLLLGCSIPIWLAEKPDISGLSGIISIGIGDAFASIIGIGVGRIKIVKTDKTVEGLIGGFMSMCIFLYFLNGFSIEAKDVICLFLISLWEVFNAENDNLTLPLVSWSLFSIFNAIKF